MCPHKPAPRLGLLRFAVRHSRDRWRKRDESRELTEKIEAVPYVVEREGVAYRNQPVNAPSVARVGELGQLGEIEPEVCDRLVATLHPRGQFVESRDVGLE